MRKEYNVVTMNTALLTNEEACFTMQSRVFGFYFGCSLDGDHFSIYRCCGEMVRSWVVGNVGLEM